MERPTPVATGYTLEFVRTNLPAGASSILEIGCGFGEVAAGLADEGFTILAIDSDPHCVAVTAERGIECHHAHWPVDLGRSFDAILFTRSLHHIHPLGESVAAARSALRPGGMVIVEDFRSEGASAASSSWYKGLARLLAAAGAFGPGFHLEEALGADDLDGHELSSSVDIEQALSSCFSSVRTEDSAYYFRYLESFFLGRDSAAEMLDYELSMIAAGSIPALGRRFIASA